MLAPGDLRLRGRDSELPRRERSRRPLEGAGFAVFSFCVCVCVCVCMSFFFFFFLNLTRPRSRGWQRRCPENQKLQNKGIDWVAGVREEAPASTVFPKEPGRPFDLASRGGAVGVPSSSFLRYIIGLDALFYSCSEGMVQASLLGGVCKYREPCSYRQI